jgi:hypothetical protein
MRDEWGQTVGQRSSKGDQTSVKVEQLRHSLEREKKPEIYSKT